MNFDYQRSTRRFKKVSLYFPGTDLAVSENYKVIYRIYEESNLYFSIAVSVIKRITFAVLFRYL